MDGKQPKIYAVRHKDPAVRAASRSGGIFTAVSDHVISEQGVVYGCALTEDLKAVHIRAEKREERDRMRGSKYVQSELGDTFRNVSSDLQAGRTVLFSGTPCQVAGLKGYLGKPYDNLFCVDIACHGVPSPKVWAAYLRWQEERNGAKIVAADFRNKRDFGWRAHRETLVFDNGKCVSSTVFRNLFYGHAVLRPSCSECPYKSVWHPGDMTIADYWGIEKAAPEFDDDKGVSLVLIHNEAGQRLFDAARGEVEWKQTRMEDSMQPSLEAPFPKPADRDQFWQDFSRNPFGVLAKKYGGAGAANALKRGFRKIMRKLVGK